MRRRRKKRTFRWYAWGKKKPPSGRYRKVLHGKVARGQISEAEGRRRWERHLRKRGHEPV